MKFLNYIWKDKPSLIIGILFIAMGFSGLIKGLDWTPFLFLAVIYIIRQVNEQNKWYERVVYSLRGERICLNKIKAAHKYSYQKTRFEKVVEYIIYGVSGGLLIYIIVRMFLITSASDI